MKKNNIQLVKNIPLGDRKDYVELIADAVFEIDSDGNPVYRPYMFEECFELGFYVFAVKGIEFEQNDDGVFEDIVSACRADEEVASFFNLAWTDIRSNDTPLRDDLWNIRDEAKDLIEFRKSDYLANRKDVVGEFANGFNQIGRLIASIDFERLDSNIIVQSLVTAFAKTPAFQTYLETVSELEEKTEDGNAHTDDQETDITEVPENGKRDS